MKSRNHQNKKKEAKDSWDKYIAESRIKDASARGVETVEEKAKIEAAWVRLLEKSKQSKLRRREELKKISRPRETSRHSLSYYLKKHGVIPSVPIHSVFGGTGKKKRRSVSHSPAPKSEVKIISPRDRINVEVLRYGKTKREWYREVYLKSLHWANLRKEAIREHGDKCHKCSSSSRIDVHHLRYRNIFDVKVTDLQILCRACHDLEHAEIKYTKYSKKPKLKQVTQEIKRIKTILPKDVEILFHQALSKSPPGSSKSKKNHAINQVLKVVKCPDIRLLLKSMKIGKGGRAARMKLNQK